MEPPETAQTFGDVSGRRVVVTGASRGLGTAIAAAFHAAGARVALVSRNIAAADDVVRRITGGDPERVLPLSADVSDEDSTEQVADAVVAAWGGLDVWISNAGVSPVLGGPLETPVEAWRQVLDVNLTAAFLGARAAARVMNRGGRIIVTGSVLGERPRRGLSAYSASKAGVVGLVKALALDLADLGITVNAVNPGWFDTPMTEPWQNNEPLARSVLGHTALGRWGAPEELTGAYLFLASRAADFVTGTVVTVDGGYACV